MESGVKNFLLCCLALTELGYTPLSIRLDSGDLANLSIQCKQIFAQIGQKYNRDFSHLKVIASNDINEATIKKLQVENHQIDLFGIGTNLVTCQAQPALGMVYKVCEFKGIPRIKLSEEPEKTTVAGSKSVLRAYSAEGKPVFDLLCMATEYQKLQDTEVDQIKVFDRISKEQIDLKVLGVSKMECLSIDLFKNGHIKFNLSLKERKERVATQLELFGGK